MLLWTMIAINVAHSILVTIVQGKLLFKIYTVTDPCDMLMSPVLCYSLRLPANTCSNAHTTIHLSLIIERAIALKNLNTYESSGASTGLALVAFSLVSSAATSIYGWHKYNFSEEMYYCAGATKATSSELSAVLFFLISLEAATLVVFCSMYYISSKKRYPIS
ncbi:hypothetical protein OESDEN_09104 [Oesophagostomum dentatum]|uniref:Uncharacterized protein n=1 Tax=Oesophagostomum dentatum TaxID=61180 RepID=A0A0B1T0F9_OESDE|nr:hypothetical protein OESDEN_09104 [Oesophagostomum dentatum]